MLPITASCIAKVYAVAAYKEPIKSLIIAKSWSDSVAAHQLGNLMWERTDIKSHAFDYIIPIPLHWTRLVRRGFNQAQEMAQVLSKKSGKPLINLLKRCRYTKFQSALPINKRAENVHSAFQLTTKDKTIYTGKHLLIVDDLLTTGSTVRVAAKELLLLKPASITIIVAARIIPS